MTLVAAPARVTTVAAAAFGMPIAACRSRTGGRPPFLTVKPGPYPDAVAVLVQGRIAAGLASVIPENDGGANDQKNDDPIAFHQCILKNGGCSRV